MRYGLLFGKALKILDSLWKQKFNDNNIQWVVDRVRYRVEPYGCLMNMSFFVCKSVLKNETLSCIISFLFKNVQEFSEYKIVKS